MILRAHGLSIDLGAVPILKDVSFDAEGGQIVGLIGPNGAGKTTLLRGLAGLLQYRGEALLEGEELARMAPGERARRIAYLPQAPEVAWPLPSREIVRLGRLPHGGGERAEEEELIARLMEETDTARFAERPIDRLSGGERARVLLARALAVEAPLLLADEPVAALDPAHQIAIMRLLRRRARAGALILVVLHDLTLAARFCDRLLLLSAGRLAADGTPREVLTRELLSRHYGVSAHLGEHEGRLYVLTDLPDEAPQP